MKRFRRALLGAAAVLFLISGTAHFWLTEEFARIVPPSLLGVGLPDTRLVVYISGVAELAGAVGLLIPELRRAAGWGLAVLLVAVFPANVYMAQHRIQIGSQALPEWVLWGRLLLQPILIAWVRWCSRR